MVPDRGECGGVGSDAMSADENKTSYNKWGAVLIFAQHCSTTVYFLEDGPYKPSDNRPNEPGKSALGLTAIPKIDPLN